MSTIDNAMAARDAAHFDRMDAEEALTEASNKLAAEWEKKLTSDEAGNGVEYLDTRLHCEDMLEDYSNEDLFKAIMSGDAGKIADDIREKMSDLAGDHLEHVAEQNANDY